MTKFLDTKGLERVISKLKTLIAGKADKSHTHTKSQISDFPKSLPASDVAAWAKAATKPGYSWGEISSKPSTFAPSSHTHSYIVPDGDYRYVATTPNDYDRKLNFAGIKVSSTIGSPTTNTYAYLVGLRGYGDSSGGNSHEIAFYNGGISHRDGSSTSWGSWKQLIDSGNIGSQSVKYATTAGTANAVAWGNVTGKPSTFAPSSHTHSQYLTSHQSLADYYTKTDCDSKFQAKGSYAAANHTHSQYLTSIMDLVVAEFSGQGSLSHIFPAGSIKKDVRIIICGSPSGDPSLNENSLPAAMTDGYCVEILSLFYSMSVTLHMPFMMFSQNNWYKGSSIRISPGILYRFICYNGALWNMRKID